MNLQGWLRLMDRFVSKFDVSETGCWLWSAGRFGNGYGAFKIDGKTIGAHCVSFRLFKGPYRKQILHRCDNTLCVNPDHLFEGTQTDNMRDKVQKGRGNFASGERHGISVLTSEDILNIRASGLSQRALAQEYGVSQKSIWAIKSGKTWRGV